MMTEPAQVSCLCEDGHRNDWTDPWDLAQALVVGMITKDSIGMMLNLVALPD